LSLFKMRFTVNFRDLLIKFFCIPTSNEFNPIFVAKGSTMFKLFFCLENSILNDPV